VIRGYAICSQLHSEGPGVNTNPQPPYIHVRKFSAITTPSRVWVFVEPNEESHEPPSFRAWWVDQNYWGDIPTDRHNGSGNFSFADGHVESHRWKAPKEKRPGDAYLIQPGGDRDDHNWMFNGRPRRE